jgi:erythromycin esterase
MKLPALFTTIMLFGISVIVQSQNDAAIKWLDQNALKIKTVQAENGLKDLMPLKNILKDKRIVALGEATHGTKEFFEMKHRMLEFLVKEMGFRFFAIEANLTEAYAVNDYVLYGKGDPQKALDGIYFWTWNTKEVMAMIEWMRAYNTGKADKDKVRFYGFDMQAQPVAVAEFHKYLMSVDSAYALRVKDLVSRIKELKDIPGNKQAKECGAEVGKIFTHLEENKQKYIATTSTREYELQKHNLVIVSQYIAMISETDTAAMCQVRDSCMSENVKWFMHLEGDSAKFVLWAHNGHIAKEVVTSDGLTMGYFLMKYYKDNYYALGFDFYQGSFQSIGAKVGLVEFQITLKQNSTGYIFSRSKKNMFFIDFASAQKNDGMKQLLRDSIPSIFIGAIYSDDNQEQNYVKKPLAEMYDGLIFIRTTHRAEPNHSLENQAVADFGNLMSRVNAKPYAGKQFRFSAFVKMGSDTANGQGQLWCRVDKEDKTPGFFDNMGDRPIKSLEWKYFEINGTVDNNPTMLYFGSMLIGTGELYVDDISLQYLEDGKWLPITIPDPTFESFADNVKPEGWMLYDKKCRILVTGKTAHNGNKCVHYIKEN